MYVIYNTNNEICGCSEMKFLPEAVWIDEDVVVANNKFYRASQRSEIAAAQLAECKSKKLTSLKSERDTFEVADITTSKGTFDYDIKSRERINAAITALDLGGGSLYWTLADNTSVLVTADDLRQVVGQVAIRSNTLHEAYRVAKEKVAAAQTKEEVEAVKLLED